MTTKGRYALRACLAMARLAPNNAPISVRQLAEAEKLSSVFLEQLFFKLRKADLVQSVRGASGGFLFSRPIDQITVAQILEAVGEGMELSPCQNASASCQNSAECRARHIWNGATAAMYSYFSGMSLSDAALGPLPDGSEQTT